MNPITPTDWTELFNQMNPSTKRESLMLLRTFVRNADDEVRILGAEYLKDVRIRKSTSSDVDKIVDYLRSHLDERGIGGYISKAIAVHEKLVDSSITTSSWTNIIKQVTKQVPSLFLHEKSLPNPGGKAGRRAKLYVTNRCDAEALFNARANLYDPTNNESDARTMVKHILDAVEFSSVGIGNVVTLQPKVDSLKHPLFPKWDFLNDPLYYTFVTESLIPRLEQEGHGNWQQIANGRSLRRVA